MEYIGGKQLITEALKSGHKLHKIYFQNEAAIDKNVIALAKEKNIPLERISKELELRPELAQGLLALAEPYNYADFDMLANSEQNGVVLILDHLEDPHNLGAIIRTALCAGAKGLIIPDDRSVKINSTVLKVSAGAAYYLPVVKVKNINQAISKLKDKGFWIYGADMNGDINLFNSKLDGLLGIVVGNEGKGLSKMVRDNCDGIVSIPQVGSLGSLNVSVATGVILYELFRQRSINGVK